MAPQAVEDWRSRGRLSLQVDVEIHERQPDVERLLAFERHDAERGRGGVLQRALQARLVAFDQLCRRLKFGASVRETAGGSASRGTRCVYAYHQAMSCGSTNETVVHHGPSPPRCSSQRSNWPGRGGPCADPAGPAVGRGKGAAGEAVAASAAGPDPPPVPVARVRCHFRTSRSHSRVRAASSPTSGKPGSSVLPPVIRQPVWCV